MLSRKYMRDCLGNPLTLDDGASRAPVDDFVGGFIGCEARAVNILQAARDTSPIVQAYCGAVHLFAESATAAAQARPFLDRALAQAHRATVREQRLIAAIDAWAHGQVDRAIALHHEQALEHPRDLASLKLGQYHCFNIGDFDGMRRMALAAAPAAADVAALHGMLAFGHEQCHALAQAEESARRAIAMQRREPWAHHALAHVMLTQGRFDEGLDFMQQVADTWVGLNSFMVTHNWWHVALFLLALKREPEALALYDRQVWGVARDYSQDQINAVSLLARLEMAGLDVGGRWQDLADYLAPRTQDHVLPFLDLQYLYGLARAGRPEAELLLRNIDAFAQRAEGPMRHAWQAVARPAARGLVAHAQGRHAEAAEALGQALPALAAIGGSHAQRALFEQIHADARARAHAPAVPGPLSA